MRGIGAQVRVEVSLDPSTGPDSIVSLERALKLAGELVKLGLEVSLYGSVEIVARTVTAEELEEEEAAT